MEEVTAAGLDANELKHVKVRGPGGGAGCLEDGPPGLGYKWLITMVNG